MDLPLSIVALSPPPAGAVSAALELFLPYAALSLLPAALVSGALLIWGWRRHRARADHEPARIGPAVTALGLALGYAVGHYHVDDPWPIRESTDRILFLGLLAAAVALMEIRRSSGTQRMPALRFALSIAVPGWFLLNLLKRMDSSRAVAWVGGLALLFMLFWTAYDILAKRRSGPVFPMTFLLTTICGALALERSGYLNGALMAGVLAAVLTVAVLAAFAFPAFSLRGSVGVLLTLHACFWMAGYFTSNLPATSAMLLALAPAAAAVEELPGPARSPGFRARMLRASLALIPAGAAVALAWAAAPPSNPYY